MEKPSRSLSSKTPILPLKTRFSLSIASFVTDTSRRGNGTVNRRLLRVLEYNVRPNPTSPINDVVSSDISVDPSRNLWFRLFRPTKIPSSSSLPVFVFFHGGGFAFLSAAFKLYDVVCRRFARRLPAIVISVEYRLAPEHPFPSQYDDGFDTLKFLDENYRSILPENTDLSRCFLAGDSAGANLAHHVAVRACQEKFQRIQIIGLIAMQPFFGGEERTESELRLDKAPIVSVSRTDWLWSVFLPAGSNRDHPAANVSGPNAINLSGLTNFPSTVIFVSGFDPLQVWQRRYYRWLQNSGKEVELVEFPSMIHAFYIFPELPESSVLISNVTDFVSRCCSKSRCAI